MHEAWSKRTSANGNDLQCGTDTIVGSRIRAERVEREQRGADDRRRGRRVRSDRRADLCKAARDCAEEPRGRMAEQPAAEHDLDWLALEPEARDRDAREGDDLR